MDLNRWSEIQQHPPNPNISTYAYPQFYNAPQSSYANYSYCNPSHQIQNPNTGQIQSTQFDASLDSSLRPPGTDSYAHINSNHPPHIGYEGQPTVSYGYQSAQVGELLEATNYQDPSVAQNWDSIQHYGADPLSYPVAIKSQNTKTIVSTSLTNDVIKGTPKKTKIMQSMRCEVCKIDCNSKDVLDRHILGKKHNRNLLSKVSVVHAVAPTSKNPRTTKKRSFPGEDLEVKRRKLMESGTTVDSVTVCTICNVVCNSQTVFNFHLRGKKHAFQAGIGALNGVAPLVPANPNPTFWTNPVIQPPFNTTKRWGPKKTKLVQSMWCEICKIDCNSKDVLDKHKLGKKHKNMEKLEELKKTTNTSVPTAAHTTNNPIIGPQENPLGDKGKTVTIQQSRKKPASSAPVEDVETKKRKLMEGGAASDAVRICAICNVACNSPTVFTFHLSGQKHAAMMKKQAETSRMAAPGPRVVTAS